MGDCSLQRPRHDVGSNGLGTTPFLAHVDGNISMIGADIGNDLMIRN